MTRKYFSNCRFTDLVSQYTGAIPGVIGVLGSSDPDTRPIGLAYRIGNNPEGFILWRLVVDGEALAGRWVLQEHGFEPSAPGA